MWDALITLFISILSTTSTPDIAQPRSRDLVIPVGDVLQCVCSAQISANVLVTTGCCPTTPQLSPRIYVTSSVSKPTQCKVVAEGEQTLCEADGTSCSGIVNAELLFPGGSSACVTWGAVAGPGLGTPPTVPCQTYSYTPGHKVSVQWNLSASCKPGSEPATDTGSGGSLSFWCTTDCAGGLPVGQIPNTTPTVSYEPKLSCSVCL